MKTNTSLKPRTPRGFALIASLTLLSLLAIIATGVLSLSALEARRAGLGKAQDEARANARLAMMTALSRLQETAGTDQAITAPAGIGILDEADLSLSGSSTGYKGLKNYTGVWRAAENPRNSSGKFVFNSPTYPNDGRFSDSNLFKEWLVSDADPDNLKNQDFFNSATDADSINFTKIGSGTESEPVFLVHDGSVEDPTEYIKAGTVPVSTGGRYAYWVGENNTKALVNTRDDALRNDTATGGDHISKMGAPGAYGLEAFSTLDTDQGQFSIPVNTDELDRAFSINQLELIEGFDNSISKKNFHDLTSLADSLLVNVTSGGLKKDLSLYFDGNPESGSWTGYQLGGTPPPVGPYGQTALSEHREFDTGPWSLLRQHTMLHKAGGIIRRGTTGDGNIMRVPDSVDTKDFQSVDYAGWNRQRKHIAPVIVRLSMIHSIGIEDINLAPKILKDDIVAGNYPEPFNGITPVPGPPAPNGEPTWDRNNYLLNFASFPVVTLWNPYNVPMRLDGFVIDISGGGTRHTVQVDGAPPVPFDWAITNFHQDTMTDEYREAKRGLYFNPVETLQPGQAVSFCANITEKPAINRAMHFEAKRLTTPSDLDILNDETSVWRGGFIYNSIRPGDNADHDFVAFDVRPNFSLRGALSGIFVDVSSVITIGSTEFRPFGDAQLDQDASAPGHQGLLNYEVYSSLNARLYHTVESIKNTWNYSQGFAQGKPENSTKNDSAKYSSIISWRSDPDNPVTLSKSLGSTGSTNIFDTITHTPIPASALLDDARRPFLSVDLRLKSTESSGPTDNDLNPNILWLHNIPQNSINGLADVGVRKSLDEPISESEVATEAYSRAHTMKFFETPSFNDYFTKVHPMESFNGRLTSYFGRSYTFSGGKAGQRRVIATEIPQAPLQSIAQLTHVPMMPIDASRWSNLAVQNYAIGNSYALPHLASDSIIFPGNHPADPTAAWGGWKVWQDPLQNKTAPGFGGLPDLDGFGWIPVHALPERPYTEHFTPMRFVDRSYVANTLLWDDFFFSGLSDYNGKYYGRAGGSNLTKENMIADFVNLGKSLPNPTYRLNKRNETNAQIINSWEGSNGYKEVASHLKIAGGFNVNSLSVKAWKALLSSNLRKKIPTAEIDGSSQGESRFVTSTSDEYIISRNSIAVAPSNDDLSRWANYHILDDDDLTEMADKIVTEVAERGPFRSVGEFVNRRVTGSGDKEFRVKGALQAALDKSVNEDLNSSTNRISATELGIANYRFPEAAQQSRYAGTPEYVMQSDLLQSIGPVLQARSDSFTIRAYGVSSNGQAKAWCEALVTRDIELIDQSASDSLIDPTSDLSEQNQRFGRRFKIVSFRWLDESEV